jgi:hypothetical protein
MVYPPISAPRFRFKKALHNLQKEVQGKLLVKEVIESDWLEIYYWKKVFKTSPPITLRVECSVDPLYRYASNKKEYQ